METEVKGYLGDLNGIQAQAKRDGVPYLQFISNAVINKLAADGKDHLGRDLDVQKEVQNRVDAMRRKFRCEPGSVREKMVTEWAVDSYGVAKEMDARGIGANALGEKFFSVAYNTPLFPAFLATSFIEGRISAGLVDLMTYADVQINRLSYDKIRLNEAEDERKLRNVGIGADLPLAELSQVGTTIKMLKYGRRFQSPREFVDMSPVDVIAGFARKLGRQVAVDETDEALEILHAGDGETGSAVTDTTPATNATLVYNDLVKVELEFDNNYMADVMLATAAEFRTIAQMAEYKDPLANRGVTMGDRRIPNVPTPSGGGRIWRWSSTGSTYMAESGGRVAAIDSSEACFTIRNGDVLEEQDTIIRSGRIEVAMSYLMAVVKGDPSCFKSLDITA